MGKVLDYILEKMEKRPLLFSVIDPLDHPSVEHTVEVAKAVEEEDGDLILVGGSTGVQGPLLEATVKAIKEEVSLPVVLFPGNIATITQHADAIYFLSLMNSRNPYWITRAQMLAAPVLKRLGIEAIGTAYVVVEPGGTVGWVGDVDLIPRNKAKIAGAFAAAAEIMGFPLFLLDSGSAPPIGPVPGSFVKEVRKYTSLPLIVAGGIRTVDQARDIVKAGANALQIGTAFEKGDAKRKVRAFMEVLKG